MLLSPDFWPLFWTVLGTGAALTVVLSLLIATIPLPRRHRQPQPTVIEETPRYREETSQPIMAATGAASWSHNGRDA